jgi:hypothetical protein
MNKTKNIAWIPCNSELSRNRLFELTASRDSVPERFSKAHQLLIDHGYHSNTFDLCDMENAGVGNFRGEPGVADRYQQCSYGWWICVSGGYY